MPHGNFAAAAERAFLHYAGCCGGRLLYVVQSGLNQNFVLNVQVNGTSVGTVASEQVFESAREDVRSRITNAEAVMASTGAQVSDDSWDVTPTYTLESGSSTMTETEAADAILCASSDQIGEATAVYVDDSLRFVTTEGDHLRTYLESVKRLTSTQWTRTSASALYMTSSWLTAFICFLPFWITTM